ncbi:MAG: B12-binding domain-containing radical SAM protein [Acidobacteria bacterium]|nr:B12-binding domain-containing radical SAM protein [Acidobacteriota bacterium]
MKFYMFNVNELNLTKRQMQSEEPAPLGLGYIKSYVEKYSDPGSEIDIRILRTNVWNILQEDKPEIIGISSVTEHYEKAIEVAYRIRNSGLESIIILGGIHISNMPESLSPVFDCGVVGEGELPMKELLETIYKDRGLDRSKLPNIKGICFYDAKGEYAYTGEYELIRDMDTIPYPYRRGMGTATLLTMFTSRGCPFRCTYCSSTSFWKKIIRFHSAEYAVEEMKMLVKDFGARHISIWDDLFGVNAKRLAELADVVEANKKHLKGVSFGVTCRASCLSEDIARSMKRMNVTRIALGLESGSDKVLREIKGRLTAETNRQAVELLKKHDFYVSAGFIIGNPGETVEDMQKTYDFIVQSKLHSGGVGLAVAFPNTEYWNYAAERGLVHKHMNFNKLKLVFDFSTLKESEIVKFNDQATFEEIRQIGIKIQSHFAVRNTRNLFSKKVFNVNNVFLVLRHPFVFSPYIVGQLKFFVRQMLSQNMSTQRIMRLFGVRLAPEGGDRSC